MKKPSEMPREIDIHFFRDNLVPMWEDSPEGGIVILKIKKDDNVDRMWEAILFAMIGKSSTTGRLRTLVITQVNICRANEGKNF